VWWREIVNICDGVSSAVESWFPDNLRLKVSNGSSTLFWVDRWVDDVPLRVRFRRLFD
jgi:hypothetical protein